jgi:hypothetical protein
LETEAERNARQNAERAEELRRVPLQTINKSKWPKDVRPIGMSEADGLGIDPDGRLYWNGKPVEIIGRRIDLTWTQIAIAFAVAIFTAIGALGTLAQGGIAYHDCRNKEPSIIACPTIEPVRHSVPDSD